MGQTPKPLLPATLHKLICPKINKVACLGLQGFLRNIDGIAHIELNEEDVVRHKLVKSIIKAYNKEDEKNT